MTQADFTQAPEQELRLRGRAFSRADLQEFVADACVWPLIVENPDVQVWVREFTNRGRQSTPA
jgi:hypothetical protein